MLSTHLIWMSLVSSRICELPESAMQIEIPTSTRPLWDCSQPLLSTTGLANFLQRWCTIKGAAVGRSLNIAYLSPYTTHLINWIAHKRRATPSQCSAGCQLQCPQCAIPFRMSFLVFSTSKFPPQHFAIASMSTSFKCGISVCEWNEWDYIGKRTMICTK